MYPSDVPARPKLLPRPCPQCGKETGGYQIILFNPVYCNRQKFAGALYTRKSPYVILRISHGYSKTERTKNNTRKKITHNFRHRNRGPLLLPIGVGESAREITSDELFREPVYVDRQSVVIPQSDSVFEYYRTYGWPDIVETHGAHWISKKRKGLVKTQTQQTAKNVILSSALATLS